MNGENEKIVAVTIRPGEAGECQEKWRGSDAMYELEAVHVP